MVNLLGFLTPKNEEHADPDLEYVWLGDVETGHYASVLGSPNYQEAVRAYARGEKMKDPPTQDPDTFINEFTPNGRSIASLIKTGFLSAQDYVVLDNSATTLKEAKAAGGKQGLNTLLTLATPRREKMKSQLREKYDEDHNVPQSKRFKVAKLHDFQPGVQTYIWALDEAALKRQRTRMRRRAIVRRRQPEIRYDAYLRRGGAPFRGPRTDAETHQVVEESTPISGKAYIEQDHICTYWYNPTLKRWSRMLGVDTSYDNKRKALLGTRGRASLARTSPSVGRAHDVEDTFYLQSGKRKQQSYGAIEAEVKDEMFMCMDKEGNNTLHLHQQWLEHRYALPTNKGECEGLCSFSDGWIFPEGADGIPNDIELAFDEHGEPLATHVTCAACRTRLCRKCYFTMLKYHASNGPNLAQFVNTYFLYRTRREVHPIDSPTYASFINLIRRENPNSLEYDEEDPELSGDYNDHKKKKKSRQGAASQREVEKGTVQKQLEKQEKKERKRLEQEEQWQQLPLQSRQFQEQAAQQQIPKTHPYNIPTSNITTPPDSPELFPAIEGHRRFEEGQRMRDLATPPTTTTQRNPRGGSQQTRGTQQPAARAIPRDNTNPDQQLRGKEIRGRFGGRRGRRSG